MDLAVGGFEKARDQPQRRGLAAAGGPEQADQLSMIDFQGNVIDHRKRAKSLGQAAQIHRRQSPHSHSCSCTDQRPAWYASIRTKTGWERELSSTNEYRLPVLQGTHDISHCEIEKQTQLKHHALFPPVTLRSAKRVSKGD